MFKKIAAAIAFSPRMEAILSEASRLSQLFNAELILVHVGEKDEHKKKLLQKKMEKVSINPIRTPVLWESGDPAKSILATCKRQQVDLLIAGALQKENIFKYYTGSVARDILRKAPCSVLVLIEPGGQPERFRRIVIHAGERAEATHTISAACLIGKRDRSSQLHILKELKMYGFTMALAGEDPEHTYAETRRNLVQEEIDKVKELMSCCSCEGLKINIKIVAGQYGAELVRFSRQSKADLLVVAAPGRDLNILDRMFPHDLEHILADLPCNLLWVQAD